MAKRRATGGVSAILAVLLLAAAYVASPFHAAYALREAMKAGDAGYLEANIQWPTVRETLRASLHAMADPAAPASPTLASTTVPRKSLWARVKSYAARKTVDGLVDTYANPEDLPQLFTYGTAYRNVVHGPPEEKSLANLPQRVREFWSRIRRAEFKHLTAFELEMRDRHTPDRTYTGLLELQGLSWKLTELRVHRASGVNGVRPQV
jgi:hypothetical protein